MTSSYEAFLLLAMQGNTPHFKRRRAAANGNAASPVVAVDRHSPTLVCSSSPGKWVLPRRCQVSLVAIATCSLQEASATGFTSPDSRRSTGYRQLSMRRIVFHLRYLH